MEFKVGQQFKTQAGYIVEIIKIAPNWLGNMSVYTKTYENGKLGNWTTVKSFELFESEINEGIYTPIEEVKL